MSVLKNWFSLALLLSLLYSSLPLHADSNQEKTAWRLDKAEMSVWKRQSSLDWPACQNVEARHHWKSDGKTLRDEQGKWVGLEANYKAVEDCAMAGDRLASYVRGVMRSDSWHEINEKDIVWIEEAAKAGQPFAQNRFGEYLMEGQADPKNAAQAMTWFEKASRQGLAQADVNMGVLYLRGDIGQPSPKDAIRFFRKAAAQGNANALFYLGLLQSEGLGTSLDMHEALRSLKQAADQQSINAESNFAADYWLGCERKIDFHRSALWYQQSDDRQWASVAAYALSVLSEKVSDMPHDDQSVRGVLEMASNTFSLAAIRLGQLSQEGNDGPKDLAKAYELYEYRASEDPNSPYLLSQLASMTTGQFLSRRPGRHGHIYDRMIELYTGAPLDPGFEEANGKSIDIEPYQRIYFRKIMPILPWATDHGDRHAAFDLGIASLRGWSVAKNSALAYQYFMMAAVSGYAPAQHAVGLLSEHGIGISSSAADAHAWYEKAAAQHYPPAQYDLGRAEEDGVGCTANVVNASQWYMASSAERYAPAMAALGRLYLEGHGVSKDNGKAIDWLWKSETPDAELLLGRIYENGWGTHPDLNRAYRYYYRAAGSKIPEATAWIDAHKDIKVDDAFNVYPVEGPYDLHFHLKPKDGSFTPWTGYKDWYMIETSRVHFYPKFSRPLSQIDSLAAMRKAFELANLWILFPEKKRPEDTLVPTGSACEPNGIKHVVFTSFEGGHVKGYVTGVVDYIMHPTNQDRLGYDTRERADLKYHLAFDLPYSENAVKPSPY